MRTQNNYFTMPNEVFQLGLSAGELAVYSLSLIHISEPTRP